MRNISIFSALFVLLLTFSDAQITNKRVPTLLVSLDGLRSVSLEKLFRENPNSNLKKYFVDAGVKAEYMKPAYPTNTFPNHFSLITGLNVENHGIVSNTVYDPVFDQKINLISGNGKNNAKWWDQAEPLWMTARKQGLKTASSFWVGSEVWGRNPDIFLTYDGSVDFKTRCDELIHWFKVFDLDFATLYYNEPDSTGHTYGPDANEYYDKLVEVDGLIGYLMDGIQKAGLRDTLNVIIASDHGITQMKTNGTMILKDYVNATWVNTTQSAFGVVAQIFPTNEAIKEQLYNGLKKIPNVDIYYREEVPERLHYRDNRRIAPIVAISHEGYVLHTQAQTNKGNHGFDNELETMRTIFLASGPNFKERVTISSFPNVDVYPLLCELVKVNCNPNNGTIDTFRSVLRNASSSSETTPSYSTTPVYSSTTAGSARTTSSSSNGLAASAFICQLSILLFSMFYF